MEEVDSGEVVVMKKNGMYKLGKCFCYYSHDEVVVTIGPDWPCNACMLILILTVLVCFVSFMAPKVEPLMQFLGLLIIMFALITYSLTAFKNPGLVLQDYQEALEQGKISKDASFCRKCHVVKTSNTDHCDDCDLCVENLDHHCPVSGKCIAKGNLLYFYLFLISVFTSFVYFVI